MLCAIWTTESIFDQQQNSSFVIRMAILVPGVCPCICVDDAICAHRRGHGDVGGPLLTFYGDLAMDINYL